MRLRVGAWTAVTALAAASIACAATPACPPQPPIPKPSRVPRCAFSDADLSYAGSAREQALCLMPRGEVGHFTPRTALGAPLDQLVGTPAMIDRNNLLNLLAASGVAYQSALMQTGLSHARGGDPGSPQARYFVIHDTSSPIARAPFPHDGDSRLNQLGARYCDGTFAAHAFVNRLGRMLFAYDYATPWRATKFESTNPALKGLFLHVELNQPRRPHRGENLVDASITPDPAFTQAQYKGLALLYMTASARAGHWLIPAFHSVIDSAWVDDHDDPRGFDLALFDKALAALLPGVRP